MEGIFHFVDITDIIVEYLGSVQRKSHVDKWVCDYSIFLNVNDKYTIHSSFHKKNTKTRHDVRMQTNKMQHY